MDKIIIAGAAFFAGYLVADYIRKPRVATNTAEGAANANMGKPRPATNMIEIPATPKYFSAIPPARSYNYRQPYNPDSSGRFNYATGGFPYSM